MYVLSGRSKQTVAYLYNNSILHADTLEVIGIILGSCVFGKDATVKGKYYNQTIRNVSGQMVAVESQEFFHPDFDKMQIMQQTWQLLMQISDHICPWVQEREEWSAQSLTELLTTQKVAATF